MSETIFWCMFIPFILWTFSPFVTARKRFYTAVLYARLLMVLVSECSPGGGGGEGGAGRAGACLCTRGPMSTARAALYVRWWLAPWPACMACPLCVAHVPKMARCCRP